MPLARGVFIVSGMELNGQRVTTCLIEEAFGRNVDRGPFELKCCASDKIFTALGEKVNGTPPNVRAAGEKLYEALAAHPPVKSLLSWIQSEVLPTPPQRPSIYPLFVRVDAPDVENLPWEGLFSKAFMVLDPNQRWPIGRLASAQIAARPLERIILPELRIAVVIAAQGEKGLEEWNRIARAIEARDKLPVSVLALVSEEEVHAAILAKKAEWKGAAVSREVDVAYTGDPTQLLSRLRTYLPNVIHIFCHGTADAVSQLELETLGDRVADEGQSSIVLGIEHLQPLAQMGSLWLFVLNCCKGGKGTPQLHSFAQQLVTSGTPAVVAMRESVDVNDANLFSEQFYLDLFTQFGVVFKVRATAVAAGTSIPVSELLWLQALHEARLRLSREMQRSPDSSVEWTYPVVYVNRDELKLLPRNQPTFQALTESQRLELVAELDMLRAMRAALDPLIDAEANQQRAMLDTQIADIQNKIGR